MLVLEGTEPASCAMWAMPLPVGPWTTVPVSELLPALVWVTKMEGKGSPDLWKKA